MTDSSQTRQLQRIEFAAVSSWCSWMCCWKQHFLWCLFVISDCETTPSISAFAFSLFWWFARDQGLLRQNKKWPFQLFSGCSLSRCFAITSNCVSGSVVLLIVRHPVRESHFKQQFGWRIYVPWFRGRGWGGRWSGHVLHSPQRVMFSTHCSPNQLMGGWGRRTHSVSALLICLNDPAIFVGFHSVICSSHSAPWVVQGPEITDNLGES